MIDFQKLSDQPAIGIASRGIIQNRIDADFYKPVFVENEKIIKESEVPYKKLGYMWLKGNYGSLIQELI